jgi:hypothetical protein
MYIIPNNKPDEKLNPDQEMWVEFIAAKWNLRWSEALLRWKRGDYL